jgi:hypothetical protein
VLLAGRRITTTINITITITIIITIRSKHEMARV